MKYIFAPISFLLLIACKTNLINNSERNSAKVGTVESYMNLISEENLKKNLYVLASDDMEGRFTGTFGSKRAGVFIVDHYKALGIKHPSGISDYYQKVPAEYMNAGRFSSVKFNDSDNILAFIPGKEKPDEVIIISAHYDHIGKKNNEIYNGADDDGSGTVAVMEMAKVFQKAVKEGKGPKRSILFLHVTAEEIGLFGSRYYAKNPVIPIKNSVVDINIDMIGRRDDLSDHKKNPNYVYVVGADRLSSELKSINEEANKKYIGLNLDYKYDDRNDPENIYKRSDHYSFAEKGIPAIFFFNGIHEDYHKESDEAHKIEYDLLTKRTKLAFVLAWELANREQRIKVDRDGK